MHITYRYPPQPAFTFIVMLFFLVIYVLCKHYAGATCILHCTLFNNYYTRLPSHQLHLHKRRKKLCVSPPLFYIIVFWPFDNFPNGISWISWKGSVKQETWFTSVVYTTVIDLFVMEYEKTYEVNRIFLWIHSKINEFEQSQSTPVK